MDLRAPPSLTALTSPPTPHSHLNRAQHALRTASTAETGTSNDLGDRQLAADVVADEAVLKALRSSGAVETASSEEQPHDIALGGFGYSVAFDPLDGSSVIPAGWAVGSIFGVWPGSQLVGRPGSDQVAAAYALYGPRTLLVVAGGLGGSSPVCQEFTLGEGGAWALARDGIAIGDGVRTFAPANLRAAAENEAYGGLVRRWLEERYTLRYSGALVPDLHHVITRGGGVFCNPTSAGAKPKLRLLYEVAPLAYVTVAAGGAATDEAGPALDKVIAEHGAKGPVCLGGKAEVEACQEAMRSSVV
ncbi:hypothetical protein ACKKBG_A21600 [Auxenochlorella protothecoides x Auxenochlorella symbiontica]